MLISLRKEYDNSFNSTSLRNDQVWDMIVEKMTGFSRNQIKDRWQYLRKRYLRKKENRSDRDTGGENIKFDYFDEMDDILGKKPNIAPKHLASSLQGALRCDVTDDALENDASPEEPPQKKQASAILKKNDVLSNFINYYKENSLKKEERTQARHDENMALKNKAIDVFGEKMDKLINKIN